MGCPAGCCAGCHASCSSHALRSGSSCVLHKASFIRSSFHSLQPCSQYRNKSYWLFLITISAHDHISTLNARLVFIRSFFAPFISALYSPPAANISCARRSATACVTGLFGTKPRSCKHATKAPPLCAHHGLTAIALCAPGVGTRRVISVRSSLQHPYGSPVVPDGNWHFGNRL